MTKQQIIDEINEKIVDQSYTTAESVRIVLNDLLTFADDGINTNASAITVNQNAVEDLTTTVNEQGDTLSNHSTRLDGIDATLVDYDVRLDLLENEAQFTQFASFSESPITSVDGDLQMWYSFRGVEKRYVNYTFRIIALKDITAFDTESYIFRTNKPELVEKLIEILPHFDNHKLSFVVASYNPDTENSNYQKHLTTTFELGVKDNSALIHQFFPFNVIENEEGREQVIFKAGDEIFTSIQFHAPAFNFNR